MGDVFDSDRHACTGTSYTQLRTGTGFTAEYKRRGRAKKERRLQVSSPHGGAGHRRRERVEERERGVTSAEVRSEQSDMSALGGACEATSTTGSVSSAGWMELSGSLRASVTKRG